MSKMVNCTNINCVSFDLSKNQVKICFVHSYAMRQSRNGSKWSNMAIDRIRFQNRIKSLEKVLNIVTSPFHRSKVYYKRFYKAKV